MKMKSHRELEQQWDIIYNRGQIFLEEEQMLREGDFVCR